ncbi:hypothetical protein K466DRAFT_37791 [Polyporus arcularius HHB13444]|uniref:Uncharacterized protein n=1 Tax=Polyporus arcularius HHB13444 TaxID=1314778 RepID=A0A5C3P050_9APHY|nr:hypothetical protein K466DRAFT_37791 [Polyporus arcularius HHB13444]
MCSLSRSSRHRPGFLSPWLAVGRWRPSRLPRALGSEHDFHSGSSTGTGCKPQAARYARTTPAWGLRSTCIMHHMRPPCWSSSGHGPTARDVLTSPACISPPCYRGDRTSPGPPPTDQPPVAPQTSPPLCAPAPPPRHCSHRDKLRSQHAAIRQLSQSDSNCNIRTC